MTETNTTATESTTETHESTLAKLRQEHIDKCFALGNNEYQISVLKSENEKLAKAIQDINRQGAAIQGKIAAKTAAETQATVN